MQLYIYYNSVLYMCIYVYIYVYILIYMFVCGGLSEEYPAM